jgi:hypothetical protein
MSDDVCGACDVVLRSDRVVAIAGVDALKLRYDLPSAQQPAPE